MLFQNPVCLEMYFKMSDSILNIKSPLECAQYHLED